MASEGLADIGAAPPAPPQTAADEQEGEPEALLPAAIPRWMRAVEKNIHQNRNNPPAKWFQLATIDETSRPRCRTVVFRGFVDKTSPEGLIKIITDARSQKVGQVERNPAAEACWYFERSRDQFRIAGNLRVVSPQETDERWARERVNTWKALSDNARIQFVWPEPRAPRPPDADDQADFYPPAPDPSSPPDTFCLVILTPESVDYLQLKPNPQLRHLFTRRVDESSGQMCWDECRVNP
ncbi:unnamed protein product [Vitrella brassicaformis CCMP3155]|uniref:Pyridoxamine 5'-phosphate oxidase Alr4036 family FMN-binding domain-containing protein n=2 Tax=Vitrella brassicaformis TaxID=1169539 RepID=A0A0G4FFE7_VITBC|nr:unnamed protein product [Vitrella brassicaformis CCMP3155]|eukprot:CEM11802.1 unnamed protein product [Vitrella brassicaformis CCMP3155]